MLVRDYEPSPLSPKHASGWVRGLKGSRYMTLRWATGKRCCRSMQKTFIKSYTMNFLFSYSQILWSRNVWGSFITFTGHSKAGLQPNRSLKYVHILVFKQHHGSCITFTSESKCLSSKSGTFQLTAVVTVLHQNSDRALISTGRNFLLYFSSPNTLSQTDSLLPTFHCRCWPAS